MRGNYVISCPSLQLVLVPVTETKKQKRKEKSFLQSNLTEALYCKKYQRPNSGDGKKTYNIEIILQGRKSNMTHSAMQTKQLTK